ncbi:MAG: OadG family protein [Bacteroidales bacterium]|nr:OadG family protein [Bacteroidales bacterium]
MRIIMLISLSAQSHPVPEGWTLSIISVSVVFCALLILFLIYNLSGNIFSGKYKRKPRRQAPDEATAAAIAMALDRYGAEDGAVPAAIAAALHLYYSECAHDTEPGIITIRRNPASEWASKSLTFRKTTSKI